MDEIRKASVQYNDMEGSAAWDFDNGATELSGYAKAKGIDIKKYEPIGLDIMYGPVDSFTLRFLVIDNTNAEEFKNKHGRLPVIEITVEENKKDFERRLKRFNVLLTIDNDNLNDYYVTNSIHVSDLSEESEDES